MPASRSGNLFWDILTFDRLMTGPIVHLVYWCGLGLISLGGFGVVGMTVGVAIRSGSLEGMLLAVPLLISGLLVLAAMMLLWRGACEFYLAILRIAEDLRAIRVALAKNAAPTAPSTSDIAGGVGS